MMPILYVLAVWAHLHFVQPFAEPIVRLLLVATAATLTVVLTAAYLFGLPSHASSSGGDASEMCQSAVLWYLVTLSPVNPVIGTYMFFRSLPYAGQ